MTKNAYTKNKMKDTLSHDFQYYDNKINRDNLLRITSSYRNVLQR